MTPDCIDGFFFFFLLVVDSFFDTCFISQSWFCHLSVSFTVLQELWGYRYGSLQHYERLKAWVHEGEHRLDFIKAHLACTLAALQGCQVLYTFLYQVPFHVWRHHSCNLLSCFLKALGICDMELKPAHCDVTLP